LLVVYKNKSRLTNFAPNKASFLGSTFFLETESMEKKIFIDEKPACCQSQLRAIHDTLDLLSGKWKITIIGCLSFGKRRFMDLQREVEGIGSKMLSKELQELDMNGLIKRTVFNTKPVTVEYELTEYGQTLRPIIKEMAEWGKIHRKKIITG
jgi:DNA-binding HxlR family transcriptional regulator